MSTFTLVGKSGQRPAVLSLVVGHRGGRREAMSVEGSLTDWGCISLIRGDEEDILHFALKHVKGCFQVERSHKCAIY